MTFDQHEGDGGANTNKDTLTAQQKSKQPGSGNNAFFLDDLLRENTEVNTEQLDEINEPEQESDYIKIVERNE